MNTFAIVLGGVTAWILLSFVLGSIIGRAIERAEYEEN